MATSGSITTTLDNGGVGSNKSYLTFSWERIDYSIQNNTSTISWSLVFGTKGDFFLYTTSEHNWSVTIDGKVVASGENNPSVGYNESKTIATGTTTISHNTDGSKTFSISASQELGAPAKHKWITINGTQTLDVLPKATPIFSVQELTDESESGYISFYNPSGRVEKLEVYISLSGDEKDEDIYREIPSSLIYKVDESRSYYRIYFTDEEREIMAYSFGVGEIEKTIRYYLRTIIEGEAYLAHKSTKLTFLNYTPTLNPTVKDVNERTLRVTGNENTLVRYMSNVEFSSGAAARKGAWIENQYVACGSEIMAGNMPDGIIEKVESGEFKFSATDTRGHTTTKTITKTIIPYIKLTCNIDSAELDTNGDLTFTIIGKYYNGSFGAMNNSFEVSYDLSENGMPMYEKDQPLGVVTPTVDEEGNYTYSYTIRGLVHTNQYELKIYVYDELTPTGVQIKTVLGNVSIFDWGKNDFNFNVPVEICNRFKVTKEGQIHGVTNDDSFIQVMDPCNNNNNLVIGYGNYAAETETPDGAWAGTNVYGNTVNFMHKNGITINWTPLADFVVEQKSVDTWFYRKWNSGRVELYGYQNVSNVVCNTAFGNMYRTAVLTPPSFPFTVYSPKMVSTYESEGYGAFVWHTTLTTNTKPANYYLIRPTSSTGITGKIHFQIQGSWK